MPQRTEWVEHYEQIASQYAACRWICSIGSGVVHAETEAVVELHDRLSGALETSRPLA